jgi:hypothetical protein
MHECPDPETGQPELCPSSELSKILAANHCDVVLRCRRRLTTLPMLTGSTRLAGRVWLGALASGMRAARRWRRGTWRTDHGSSGRTAGPEIARFLGWFGTVACPKRFELLPQIYRKDITDATDRVRLGPDESGCDERPDVRTRHRSIDVAGYHCERLSAPLPDPVYLFLHGMLFAYERPLCANCCRSKRAFPQGSSHLGEPQALLKT